jgi:hypothetical protein
MGLPTIGTKPKEYLDNKVHEKEIVDMVKAQFGTIRGNMGIVLRDTNDNATRFANKLMACKLLRKCKKEEALIGFIAVVTQCMKGVIFSWVSCLLNQFLIDCRDA